MKGLFIAAICLVVVVFFVNSSIGLPGTIVNFVPVYLGPPPITNVIVNDKIVKTLNVSTACNQGYAYFYNTIGGVYIQSLNQLYLFYSILTKNDGDLSYWLSVDLKTWELNCLKDNFTTPYSNLVNFVYDADLNSIIAVDQDSYYSQTTIVSISLPSFEPTVLAAGFTRGIWGTAYDFKKRIYYVGLKNDPENHPDEPQSIVSVDVKTANFSVSQPPPNPTSGYHPVALGMIFDQESATLQAFFNPVTEVSLKTVQFGTLTISQSQNLYTFSPISKKDFDMLYVWSGQITQYAPHTLFFIENLYSCVECSSLVTLSSVNGTIISSTPVKNYDSTFDYIYLPAN